MSKTSLLSSFFKGLILSICTLTAACSSMRKGESIDLPSYKEVKLKNGLPVLLIEDDSLPYISYVMMIRSGSASDPQRQSGLASLVGELLDQGTNERNAVQLSDSLGQIGADFHVSTSLDYSMATATGLSYHQDQLLKDFGEILTQPSFSQAEVNRTKAQRLSRLKQTVDNASSLAEVAFDSYLYGPHPYGKRTAGAIKDIQNLKRKSIIRYYLQNYRPNNAYMAVVGNFKSAEMVSKLETTFKDWTIRETDELKYGPLPETKGIQIQLVDKPDLKQSQIRLGHIGIKRTHPDFLKLRVANTILGGAFASRLMQEIREKRGLTYSISSRFEAYMDPGPFVISTFTRHDKVKETVQTSLEVLKNFYDSGVTEQEVEDAKNYLVGVFPKSLETPESLAMNLLILRLYGISDDYLEDYVSHIRGISKDDVNQAIKAHVNPENMKVVVFSPKSQALTPLKTLGPVEVKSYRDFL